MRAAYEERRGELLAYFDRTALAAWARLTSTAPLGRVRATVRAGREAMRAQLLAWLPADLSGRRLLDAGCGTGALALEAARRGAEVIAVDLSPQLVSLARQRTSNEQPQGSIDFRSGDMLDPALGGFDYVVAMDSLIHYRAEDAVVALSQLSQRTRTAMLFTFAPGTPALLAMHAVGRLFPRANRAPSIEPVSHASLKRHLAGIAGWKTARTTRIASGFYQSQAMELVRR